LRLSGVFHLTKLGQSGEKHLTGAVVFSELYCACQVFFTWQNWGSQVKNTWLAQCRKKKSITLLGRLARFFVNEKKQ